MKQELEKLLGLKTAVKQLNNTDIPVYMKSYRFWDVTIEGFDFIIAELPDDMIFDLRNIKRDYRKAKELLGRNTALAIPAINAKRRASLIEARIPFVALPNQVYLPFLGLILTEKYEAQNMTAGTDIFTPSAQMLFLLLAYMPSSETLINTEAAKKLGLTKMSITRAASALNAAGLINEEKHGTGTTMIKKYSGKEFVDRAMPYLIDPVKSSFYVRDDGSYSALPDSGESALSSLTMLNPPQIKCKAHRFKTDDIKALDKVDPHLTASRDYIRLEAWRYRPEVFAKDGTVDPISLYCSLRDKGDERVENELINMLEEYEWVL